MTLDAGDHECDTDAILEFVRVGLTACPLLILAVAREPVRRFGWRASRDLAGPARQNLIRPSQHINPESNRSNGMGGPNRRPGCSST